MLVYLSKKIAIPNQVRLNCISWNRDQGYIACGGENGLLKVLRLETPTGPEALMQGIAASANLSMNQTLEGHNGGVMCVTWNPIFRKLTTSDESGLIIVWMLHKGSWYEEMINNRNKSVVRDMKWTTDGRKIAIVYEDGAVIVGSVDGNRLWGKDLPYALRFVEWSPDGKTLLFVTLDAEVYIYDADGNKIRSMKLMGQDNSGLGGDSALTSIHWYAPSGSSSAAIARPGERLPSTLVITFENGKMLLSRGDDESTAELIETDLTTISFARWSTRGNILALVGIQKGGNNSMNSGMSMKAGADAKPSRGDDKNSNANMVKFFDPHGHAIRQLKIPGETIREVSWEGGDLRMALAVDSFIYFANVRHAYLWAYFLNTVVYAYPRPDRRESIVTYWDQVTQETYVKSIANLLFLVANGDFCAIFVAEKQQQQSQQQSQQFADETDTNKEKTSVMSDVYTIQLRNAIGAVVDTKTLPFMPKYVAMSSYHITAANDRTVYTWQYNTSSTSNTTATAVNPDLDDLEADATNDQKSNKKSSKRGGKCRIFDITQINFSTAQSPETFKVIPDMIEGGITAITISDKYLVLAKKDGTIQRFNIPHLTPENMYTLKFNDREIVNLKLNCTSTRLGVVDVTGVFTVLDLEAKVPDNNSSDGNMMTASAKNYGNNDNQFADKGDKNDSKNDSKNESKNGPMSPQSSPDKPVGSSQYLSASFGRKLQIDRKDVWDMKWSDDDPEMIVIMEKTKMVTFHHETPEEPILSSAYLARVQNLEVKVIALDALFAHPEKPPNRDILIDYESKLLRDVREKIVTEGLTAAYEFAEKNPHPRLWKLLAHAALEDMEWIVAEKCFVRCNDYYGILFAKNLASMPDKMKARAEVAVFLLRFDEADGLYREIDRKDLAIALRKRLGDYPRVVQLLQTGGGNDKLTREAWDQIGNQYADKMKWKKAAQYFQLSRNNERLIECFYRLEQFADLRKIMDDLSDESPLLYTLAKRFESVGMCTEAVTCYSRSGAPPKESIDCCVKLNAWDKALELAEKHDFPQVEGLLIKFAMSLVTSNRRLEAIELFRVANKPTEAAILIGDLAETVANEFANPMLAKKLHVLAALEIERHRKRAIDLATQQQQALLDGNRGSTVAQATAQTLETLMMTSLLEGGSGATQNNTLGGTLQMTLNTLQGATQAGGANTKKVSRAFANAWRGAAAYHYYMIALRQFYAGLFDAAMKTSIKLCEYDDILAPRTIYSLLCLSALKNKFFGVCSKAFVKLETLPNLTHEEKDEIQALAVQIFTTNAPGDPAPMMEAYEASLNMGRSFQACTITGRAIQDSPAYTCRHCRHSALEYELENYNKNLAKAHPLHMGALHNCPLCHAVMHYVPAAERRK